MPRYLLITLEYPPQIGGVANYLRELVSQRNDETKVLKLGEDDFFVLFWPRWVKCIKKIFKEVSLFKPDFIEISHVLPVGYMALILNFFLRIPYIVYAHGADINFPIRSGNFLRKFFLKAVLGNAEKIVCNSNFTKGLIEGFGVLNKSEVRYPRIERLSEVEKNEIIALSQEERRRLSLNDKKVLLSAGRLVRRKGFDSVIRCLKLLPEEYYYVIAGDGPMREELKKLALENNVADRIIFLGEVDNVYLFMAMSDIFILLPRELESGDVEGFGMVFLEADLFDKPVIGGNSGGVGEALSMVKRGRLVENPENLSEIKKAILEFS